jgi:hypothetical protein
LLVLIEHREQPLQAKDLIALVWDEERVTHKNFGVTLNAVRRALGETVKEPRFVVRFSAGYQFVGHVSELDYEVLDVASKGANQTPPKTLLNFPLGTLRRYAAHLMFGSSLYAMLFTVALVLEVAYRFDNFGSKALKLAPFVFFWMFATSVIGLFADRILTLQRKTFGLTISTSTFIIAAAPSCGLTFSE